MKKKTKEPVLLKDIIKELDNTFKDIPSYQKDYLFIQKQIDKRDFESIQEILKSILYIEDKKEIIDKLLDDCYLIKLITLVDDYTEQLTYKYTE